MKLSKELIEAIQDRVNHETDIITDSEWFDALVEKKVEKVLEQKYILIN